MAVKTMFETIKQLHHQITQFLASGLLTSRRPFFYILDNAGDCVLMLP